VRYLRLALLVVVAAGSGVLSGVIATPTATAGQSLIQEVSVTRDATTVKISITAGTFADTNSVVADIVALKASPTFVDNVIAGAAANQTNILRVTVWRDDRKVAPAVTGGKAVNIDVGDLAKMAAAVNLNAELFRRMTIAHEMKHTAGFPDPDYDGATKGKAVEAENAAAADLKASYENIVVVRDFYGRKDKVDGLDHCVTEFTVNGAKRKLDLTQLIVDNPNTFYNPPPPSYLDCPGCTCGLGIATVGGTVRLLRAPESTRITAPASTPARSYTGVAVGAAGTALLLGFGAWYARRRWLQ
jgi:hypothetical protein